MKIAVIGSRNGTISNLEQFLPEEVTEIVSGGAKGIDTCAKEYAVKKNRIVPTMQTISFCLLHVFFLRLVVHPESSFFL